ncbi:MAG: hypothetical protein IJE97_03430, partial [Thermoguttaceae bacterium]|nr:hypothetical protein [Thermoguttaceae bacterium]
MKKVLTVATLAALFAAANVENGIVPNQAAAAQASTAFDEKAVLDALFALEAKGAAQTQKQDQRQTQAQTQ